MHTAEEVRKEAEALNDGRIRERDAKQMLLAYADLLEAMEEMDGAGYHLTTVVEEIRQCAAEKQKARKG